MTKTPIAALNEVLLSAALRAERANTERMLDSEARHLARRNDHYAREFNRVPETPSQERTHERARTGAQQ